MKAAGKNDDVCSGSGCFNAARFVVVPCGKWRNMKARAACGGCAAAMAEAYKTGERTPEAGWAETYRRKEDAK